MKRYTLNQRGQRVAAAGFTLIEMMAVLVLIGVVMAIVGGKVWQNFQSGQYKAGTTFLEGLSYFRNQLFLYYGTADTYVGLAVADWRP